MTKRIKVDELPVFDATSYLDSEQAIAAYLTDILQANDAGCCQLHSVTSPARAA